MKLAPIVRDRYGSQSVPELGFLKPVDQGLNKKQGEKHIEHIRRIEDMLNLYCWF